MNKYKILVGAFVAIIACITCNVFTRTQVAAVEMSCSNVEAVFARGSGQGLGKSDEEKRFKGQMSSSIKAPLTLTYYELGTDTYDGHQYNPVDVSNVWNGNALGAKFSAGAGFDYGKSVDAGVGELKSYLTQRYEKCKAFGSKFVLGGYSQGAQVVGQTLPQLSSELRSQIAFVSLFGDPKLYLPEGIGVNPSACRGDNLSPWRRVIANCKVDNGSLGARKPYVPDDMKNKVGLWCYAYDFVCGSSKDPIETLGHTWYGLEARAVDMAVSETVARLSTALTPEQSEHLVWLKNPSAISGGLDVVFIIDTTNASGGRIEKAKGFALAAAQTVIQKHGRVALVECRDYGDMILPFVGDLSLFQDALSWLRTTGSKDEKPAIAHAIQAAFPLDWHDGATKAIMVLSGNSYDMADEENKAMLTSVVKRTLEIDPVNIYPVVPVEQQALYEPIAKQTSGKVIIDNDDMPATLTDMFNTIEYRPVAALKLAEYSADPGQQITFDASDSAVDGATITQYEWDYDGDGTFEQTTTEPVTHHTYTAAFDGVMQVRETASNNMIANASAKVKIGTSVQPVVPAAHTGLSAKSLTTDNDVSTVAFSWMPSDALATQWVVSVNGVAVGRVSKDTTSVELTDVQRADDVEISVAGVAANNEVGESAMVTVAKDATPPPAPVPAPPKKLTLLDLLKLLIKAIKIVVAQVHGR